MILRVRVAVGGNVVREFVGEGKRVLFANVKENKYAVRVVPSAVLMTPSNTDRNERHVV